MEGKGKKEGRRQQERQGAETEGCGVQARNITAANGQAEATDGGLSYNSTPSILSLARTETL